MSRQNLSPLRATRTILLATALACTAWPASAQTPPSDLTQLSLAELLSVDLGRPHGLWRFDYRFVDVHFEGYREGSQALSLEDVLFRPGETRTDRNFPVVPTRMVQRVHVFDVTRELSSEWRVSARVPLVRQQTQHVSVVPGFAAFSLGTGGIGDVSVLITHTLHASASRNATVSAGLTLPTGSIDETGLTPRSPDPSTVPYTMQLGSGTTDLLVGMSYATQVAAPRVLKQAEVNVSSLGRWRLGSNARNYRLGHQFSTDAQVTTRPWPRAWPSIGATWTVTGRIAGGDATLMVPGPFPYSAPVTNPSLYGGTLLTLRVGVELPMLSRGSRQEARAALSLQAARRTFAWLHGPQPPENWRLMAGWRLSL